MDEDDDTLGRRAADRYPGPEAVGVLLVQLGRDITEIKADIKEGFRDVGNVMSQHNDRIVALEKFRERVQERDRALAEGKGNLSIRLPVLAAMIAAVGVMVTIATVLITQAS